MRQHEAQRLDDVRRDPPQHLALAQGLAHQTDIEMFEIAQATMDEPGRARRGAAREITHLAEMNRKTAAGGVARDPATIDAAADDGKVIGRRHPTSSSRHLAPSLWNREGPLLPAVTPSRSHIA
jgi:hypothetical protein